MSEWTQRELYILREEYSVKPTAEIAKKLKRSANSISQKANELGLKKNYKGGIEWTPQMLKLLKNFFPIMFNKPLAKWIGVSQRTMLRKARELGLEKQEGFLKRRKKDIQDLAREALKKVDCKTRIKKGEHFNPAGEFKKGHKESEETKAKRVQSLKESWRRRKIAQVKYY